MNAREELQRKIEELQAKLQTIDEEDSDKECILGNEQEKPNDNGCKHDDFGSGFKDYNECDGCPVYRECEKAAAEHFDGCPVNETFGEFGDHDHCDSCSFAEECRKESNDVFCPHCNAKIEYVYEIGTYTCSSSIRKHNGSVNITDSDHFDYDCNGYECPECNASIDI